MGECMGIMQGKDDEPLKTKTTVLREEGSLSNCDQPPPPRTWCIIQTKGIGYENKLGGRSQSRSQDSFRVIYQSAAQCNPPRQLSRV